MTQILPVILSGGAGTRLWPLSVPDNPKPFHAIIGAETLLRHTLARFAVSGFLPPLVIANQAHRALVAEQASGVVCLFEAEGRNTAFPAAVAALWGRANAPDAVILLAPADHYIPDALGFQNAVRNGTEVARSRILTFGMTPDHPSSAYGYIQQGRILAEGIYEIGRFIEKPDRAKAEVLLASGGCSWNGGIFAFAPEVLLTELRTYAPDVLASAEGALNLCQDSILNPIKTHECPNISIDYAVMEKTQKAAVCPVDVGWADIGSFDEIWRLSPKDAQGVARVGQVIDADCESCLLITLGRPLAVSGLKNRIVVSTPAGTLDIPLGESQRVRELHARL